MIDSEARTFQEDTKEPCATDLAQLQLPCKRKQHKEQHDTEIAQCVGSEGSLQTREEKGKEVALSDDFLVCRVNGMVQYSGSSYGVRCP